MSTVTISAKKFKFIKEFYPEFTRCLNISSNDFIIDWGSIMPVIEKINTIAVDDYGQMGVQINPDSCVIGNLPDEELIVEYCEERGSLIKTTYIAVLRFIDWYNLKINGSTDDPS